MMRATYEASLIIESATKVFDSPARRTFEGTLIIVSAVRIFTMTVLMVRMPILSIGTPGSTGTEAGATAWEAARVLLDP